MEQIDHTLTTKQVLLAKIGSDTDPISNNKISIIGCGSVGMAVAVSLLTQGITTELALIDPSEDKLLGEQMDLQHGSLYMSNAKINAGNDYSITAGSKICIIAAGVRQVEKESQLRLISRNFEAFKKIIPNIVEHCPDTIILVISNPVDVFTYVAWKLSKFPKSRVIGIGTSIDTSRFRYFIAQRLGVSPTSVEGWIVGEHGDSGIPVWQSVNVAGVRLCDVNPKFGMQNDFEKWIEVYQDVVKSAGEVIRLKGYSNWGIAFCAAPICNAILKNTGTLFAVSTYVTGTHGVTRETFLSLPCIIGGDGVTHIVKQILSEDDRNKFKSSANKIFDIVDDLAFEET